MAPSLKKSLGCIAVATIGCGVPVLQALEPQMNYTLHCMGCHTPDGSEVEGRVPGIRETLLPFSRDAEGRKFLVQVPGAAQSTLSDAELAELLNWMIESLSVEQAAGTFIRYTEQEVADYRKHALITVRATRERLLAQINR